MSLKNKLRTATGIGLIGMMASGAGLMTSGTLAYLLQARKTTSYSLTSSVILGVQRKKVNCRTIPKTNKWDEQETRCDLFKRNVKAYDLPEWHPVSRVSEGTREKLGYFTGPLGEVLIGVMLSFGPLYLGKREEENQAEY